MAIANAYFQNSYSFQIAGQSKYYKANHAAITKNAIAVIDYVSNYISWKGQLDFVVNFKEAEGDGLVSSYSGTTNQGYTFAQSEAITGQDVNGRDFDIGAHIIPDAKGKLTNYGYNLYFDPNPQPYSKADIPSGNHDFFSIYLHEVIHGLGLWSVAQYNTGQASTFFDRQTIEKNGQFFFTGSKTQALLGTPLPLSVKGSRDNYATDKSGENSPIDRGVMFEYGNYEQNRWHLGKVDLAILEDLGHKIANQKNLPLVEKLGDLDIGALITKTEDGGKQFLGGIGNDIFKGTANNDGFKGGLGLDTVILSDAKINVTAQKIGEDVFQLSSKTQGTDILTNIERVQLSDGILALDIDGNAGQAYRIYKAAFARDPDNDGLKYWIGQVDNGADLIDVAKGFVASQEFQTLYGADPSSENFIAKLYQNVLGRQGEQQGIAFWKGEIDAGKRDMAQVLADFSESSENISAVAPAINDGIWYV